KFIEKAYFSNKYKCPHELFTQKYEFQPYLIVSNPSHMEKTNLN
ncbi:MAG: hypothetical protein RLZZ210_978, partial [Pseudomonadota bacterium]